MNTQGETVTRQVDLKTVTTRNVNLEKLLHALRYNRGHVRGNCYTQC